jgi:hypothetical protein
MDRPWRSLGRDVFQPPFHELGERHGLSGQELAARNVGYKLCARPLRIPLAASHRTVDVAGLSVTASTRERPDQPATWCSLDHGALHRCPCLGVAQLLHR